MLKIVEKSQKLRFPQKYWTLVHIILGINENIDILSKFDIVLHFWDYLP